MLSQTDSEGNTTKFEYDSLGQLIKVIDPLGNVTTYTYDALGRRTSVIDANGNTTHYEYNYRGQLIKVTDAVGNVTTYTYGGSDCSSCGGGADRLTSITDASGNTTTYEYDTLGRLIKETDPLGNTITYTYDAKGNLISQTDANGNTINYTYDPLGRLIQKTYPDATTEVFQYDEKGNIIYAGNQYITYEFTRDTKGRVLRVTDSRGLTIQYEYDLVGNRVKMVTPEGEAITYTYDSNNKITGIDSWAGSFNFSYDSTGRRTTLSYPNGVTTTYEYDRAGRLVKLLMQNSRYRTVNSYTYTLDNVGNRLTKTEIDRKYTYTYDAIYRLLEAIPEKLKHRHRGMGKGHDHGNKPEHYTYDPVGNRLTGPSSKDYYFYNQGNQLTEYRKYLYEYDRNGNLIKKTAIDDNGEEKIWTYSYDYENRLIKVVKKEEDEIKIVTFKYDPFGRRIEKKVEEIEDGEIKEVKTYTYVYDNEDIILEYVSISGHEEDGHHDSDDREDHPHYGRRHHKYYEKKDSQYVIKYIHGPGIDEPLAIEQKGKVYYYHADGLGSITALTNQRGWVVQRYEYDSFGNMKHHGKKVKQPYTFTGREWDKEIGLYYYRARYYDPKVGRFISFDPILRKMGRLIQRHSCGRSFGIASFEALIRKPQSLNPFVYVKNNPVNYGDPKGLYCMDTVTEYHKKCNRLITVEQKCRCHCVYATDYEHCIERCEECFYGIKDLSPYDICMCSCKAVGVESKKCKQICYGSM
jgi:RHS repeat-associated protein